MELVHLHGGSVLLDHLAAAGIPGERLFWCDPVCSGPTPAGLSQGEWYRVRGEHLRACIEAPSVDPIAARLRAEDRALGAVPAGAEIVIWAGPELFCQAIAIRLLDLLADRPGPISLVDPGDDPRWPGCTMGRLPPDDLQVAFGQRRRVLAPQLALAREAWAAFTAPTARPLATLVAGDTSALPHLGAALRRHLAELPDGATGLSTSETHALEALKAGPLDPVALFHVVVRREPRPFLTDVFLDEILRRLASGAVPLVVRDGDGRWSLTVRGGDVLAGNDTWRAERWVGGIHLGLDDDDEDEDDGGGPAPVRLS
jgi:hypothetical protein